MSKQPIKKCWRGSNLARFKHRVADCLCCCDTVLDLLIAGLFKVDFFLSCLGAERFGVLRAVFSRRRTDLSGLTECAHHQLELHTVPAVSPRSGLGLGCTTGQKQEQPQQASTNFTHKKPKNAQVESTHTFFGFIDIQLLGGFCRHRSFDQLFELFRIDGFFLYEHIGNTVHQGTVVRQDALGQLIGLVNQAAHFVIDDSSGLL